MATLVQTAAAERRFACGYPPWGPQTEAAQRLTLRNVYGIKGATRHPYEFYQKMGLAIVGVMPDASGIGKPDIYMAKKAEKRIKQ